jgi:thiol-disulfide isomerase/thioredoxin
VTDIAGDEHNLYSYLDSGYAVIIDFSATWCGPCWSYHTSGVFEEIYEAHGPDGTNEVRILFIESDNSTTDEDLHGTGANTWGDWTAGVEYPIIDNGGDIFSLYQCGYYPTIFTVCPNRILQQTGQATAAAHTGYFNRVNVRRLPPPTTLAFSNTSGRIGRVPRRPLHYL